MSARLTEGQRRLWNAVISQAVIDAQKAYHRKHKGIDGAAAIAWVFGKSKDFAQVCDMAGYEPDYIRGMAIKSVIEGTPFVLPYNKGMIKCKGEAHA